MARIEVQLPMRDGRIVPARLQVPPGDPNAAVILLHCLPTQEGSAESAIASGFAVRGWITLSIDCGPGPSSQAMSALSPADVLDAAAWLAQRHPLPLIAVGHSYGGLLAIATAGELPELRAIAVINTPAGIGGYAKRAMRSPGLYDLGGINLAIPESAEAELDWDELESRAERLRRPLLILHAPLDVVADLPNAALIFTAAKHPKSFLSLESCDHLLSRCTEANHAAGMIAAWSARYVTAPPAEGAHFTHVTVAESGISKFHQLAQAGQHRLTADEPVSAGGTDLGPSPYELLLSALGACTAMTLRMYADMKKLPLHSVSVELHHEKIHAAACQECETKEGKIDRIERVVTIEGDLTDEQRQRLLEIANKCPVHRTLHSEVWVPTRLAE